LEMRDDYEYNERAAIRQFDGGRDRPTAEGLADRDMRARRAEQDRHETLGAGGYLEELEAERKQVRNQRLKKCWQELCMKIVHLKFKEA